MAAISTNLAGNVTVCNALEIVTAPLFERLSHHFQRSAIELRKFIKKQDPMIGERDFPRLRDAAAADHAGVGEG